MLKHSNIFSIKENQEVRLNKILLGKGNSPFHFLYFIIVCTVEFLTLDTIFNNIKTKNRILNDFCLLLVLMANLGFGLYKIFSA